MEFFQQYSHTILSMAVFSLITLILSPISAAAKDKENLTAGGMPETDYSNRTYRLWRAHLNAVESIAVFATVAIAAMLAGATPFWVNLFASLFLVGRIIHVVVHVQGIGAEKMGPRTFSYIFSWLMCILLAILAICAVLA